jgi:hypothetical protein
MGCACIYRQKGERKQTIQLRASTGTKTKMRERERETSMLGNGKYEFDNVS